MIFLIYFLLFLEISVLKINGKNMNLSKWRDEQPCKT